MKKLMIYLSKLINGEPYKMEEVKDLHVDINFGKNREAYGNLAIERAREHHRSLSQYSQNHFWF